MDSNDSPERRYDTERNRQEIDPIEQIRRNEEGKNELKYGFQIKHYKDWKENL